jgi:uncharacterized protein (TIGR02118 family)
MGAERGRRNRRGARFSFVPSFAFALGRAAATVAQAGDDPAPVRRKSAEKGRRRMAKLLVLYKTPTDGAAFDKSYETHITMAKKIPGLRHYEISRGPVGTPAGPSGVHLVATLTFDNVAAIQAAFASPEGQAAAADVGKIATGGVDMLIFETAEA